MKRAILFLLALAALALPGSAHAQDEIIINTMRVRIWPEYDERAALAIVEGQALQAEPAPVELRFTLPPGVSIHIVAYIELDTFLPNDDVEWAQEGDALAIQSPNGTFWFEFYDDSLAFDGSQRSYTLNWSPGYAINSLNWSVQQPVNASNLAVQPDAGGLMSTDPNTGLPTFNVSAGNLAAGETATLSFTYTKSDNTLSVEAAQSEAAALPASQPTGEGSAASPSLPLIIAMIAAGAGLIGGGVYWYIRQTQPAPRRAEGRAGRGGGKQRFCTQCGEPVDAGDAFCRRCGTKIRG